ncbi:MAG TPA: hypothetical protein VN673_11530 [Clostridia bacterium]|nr:hypothetical protein [Clostridia bacterium]
MENRGILRLRKWSTIQKCQVVVTAIGVFLTTSVAIIHALQMEIPKYSAVGDFVLWLGLTLATPLVLLGIPMHNRVLAAISMIAVNALVCFVVGTLIGWLLSKLKQTSL